MTVNGSTYCTNCGTKLSPDDEYCMECGKSIHHPTSSASVMSEDISNDYGGVSSDTEIQPNEPRSSTVVAPVFPVVEVEADGNLPVCPKCGSVRLVWEKQAAPGWALPVCIVGVIMIFTVILFLPGIIIWAIGMYGLLQPRIVSPYCPQCRLFFTSNQNQTRTQ